MRFQRVRSSSFSVAILCVCTALAVAYALWLTSSGLFHQPWSVVALVGAKAIIEIVASVYAITFVCAAAAFLISEQDEPPDAAPMSPRPRIAVLYLCCGDLDVGALRSLVTLHYDGELTIVVHDDASAPADRAAVDAAVAEIAAQTSRRVRLLRRPERTGGKPGAVNFVLDQMADAVDWFVLCDNDSIALDPDTLEKALRRCHDPAVAAVQFRTMGVAHVGDSTLNRRLAESVNAFHVFLTVWSKFGWMPFIGHNALLRTAAVRQIGGFTPGYFADDVDLTVRLNVAGYTVQYAPEIQMGETHPSSYSALRKRSYKWSYGCMQVLKAHLRRVLTCPQLTLAEKFGFLQFVGFYAGQALVLTYLLLAFVVSPFLLAGTGVPLITGLVLGSGMILGVFLPVLAYFARERRLFRSLGTVLLFGLAYGATDFVCLHGLWDCMRNRARLWIPTNVSNHEAGEGILFAEAAFGVFLLAVPLWLMPQLLWVPSAYMFAGKFLFAPSIGRWYHHDWQWQMRGPRRRLAVATAATSVIVLIVMLTTMVGHGAAAAGAAEIRGKDFYVDGRPFLVKGVHYGPWRPGTGPGGHYPYPDQAAIDADLTLLGKLDANTILVFDAPDYVLDVAHAHGLRVLYTFNINWWALPLDQIAREQILTRVRALHEKPAVLAWILGNEVPSAVLDAKGPGVVTSELSGLYHDIKRIDPMHPISHSNWVTTKDLDLQFLDFAAFNVYPLWPPQVVALGYDGYVRRILRPIAGNKPLVITEFGVNTLEAGEEEQGTILARTWRALRSTDAAGGVVMEFADEWWKNYDNPRNPRDWWDRAFAPDDELRHDNDPEEYYGLVTAEREPKPAFAAVRDMFSTADGARSGRMVPTIIVAVLTQTSVMAWVIAWRAKGRQLP
jgi:cellulose synthase/poly-beta-1,6-N-acetylglucosamine synthase-like glycosyltransferase